MSLSVRLSIIIWRSCRFWVVNFSSSTKLFFLTSKSAGVSTVPGPYCQPLVVPMRRFQIFSPAKKSVSSRVRFFFACLARVSARIWTDSIGIAVYELMCAKHWCCTNSLKTILQTKMYSLMISYNWIKAFNAIWLPAPISIISECMQWLTSPSIIRRKAVNMPAGPRNVTCFTLVVWGYCKIIRYLSLSNVSVLRKRVQIHE